MRKGPVMCKDWCNLPLSVCLARRVWLDICCRQNGFADKRG